jgi:hypothetical protein
VWPPSKTLREIRTHGVDFAKTRRRSSTKRPCGHRVIERLLVPPEGDCIQTWSQVVLSSTVSDATLRVVVEGALGRPSAGVIEAP